jgi:hypothetical protein
MSGKRFTAERIVAKLREVEKLHGHGLMISAAGERLAVSEPVFSPAAREAWGTEERRSSSA